MPEPDREDRPVVEYGTPPRGRGGQLVAGHLLGLAAALVLVVGSALLGTYIDTRLNPGADLAGLPGLVAGAMVGLGLALPAGIVSILIGRRRGSVLLRGTGQGLLLSLGLGAITLGLCAVS